MGKKLFIAEKPSVAQEFARVLKVNGRRGDGFIESSDHVVTWCVGHLVTMSYPESYDPAYAKWAFETLPFIPETYKYEVIGNVKKQFETVKNLLNRDDVEAIYVCTDSGREGEYIYRLVDQMAAVPDTKAKFRVWIDSQTEDEILRGIREAKPLSAYDNLSASAYLRAKEDYLMGINFSRVLTLKYGNAVKDYLKLDRAVVSVGRVMTCVLGMVVNREREIRNFEKTPFFRVVASVLLGERGIDCEWRAVEGTPYFASPLLYKENGFKEREPAENLIQYLLEEPRKAIVHSIEKKKENKNAPLLYNLAELQNDCSKYFKISPDETLRIAQELYEKKMTTYPRTDARVLSTAVSKEIYKNIKGLTNFQLVSSLASRVLQEGTYKGIAKTRYVNDKQITDHYAIIPTGQGLNNYNQLSSTAQKVYEIVVRRFLSIFYPPAVYRKVALCVAIREEKLFANFKVLESPGYLTVTEFSFRKKKENGRDTAGDSDNEENANADNGEEQSLDVGLMEVLNHLKKGMELPVKDAQIREGETSPPKRYNSGTIILAMENAGQLIEDEELRAQIKGSGIGTSATRAEILKKLVNIKYLALNRKTQIITPTLMGEMIYEVVNQSIRPLLDPKLTASWEKGLTLVADGNITEQEYMDKLDDFVRRRTNIVKQMNNQATLNRQFREAAKNYRTGGK